MNGRLATSVLVGGLLRMAEEQGGFGAVLAKGDPSAGAVVVVLTERGSGARLFERILQPQGTYAWQAVAGETARNDEGVPAIITRKKRFDPDLWVLELDIPSAERFAAAMNLLD